MHQLRNTLLLLLFISCGNKRQQQAVLSLKEMSDLATVEYTVTKIVKANDNKSWYKIGDRKILMSCEANIKAGIDMSKLTKKNFTVSGNSIDVILPAPKVISLNIPAESIKTEYEEVGTLRSNFSSKERDEFVKQAEVQIKRSIDSLGVLNQAKANTDLFVANFLKRLGYDNINISYAEAKTETYTQ
jgi:hypothetical protein